MTANLELPPRDCSRPLPTGSRFGRQFASICGRAARLIVVCTFVLACCASLRAQRKEAAPQDLGEVLVTEHLNDRLPLNLPFIDHRGESVELGDYFEGELPVVLTLNYSSCPMLCSLQLEGLFDGLKKMQMDMGQKYRMITVSIDPTESTERSAMTREKYLKLYGRPGGGSGYACLTGKNKEIKRLADAVGFGYRYVPETREYAHTAVTMICTPDGRLSRYLYGVEYDQQTLRLSLLEAAEGKIGTPMEQLLLYCFYYDSEKGRYGPSAFKLMKLGAMATVFVVGGVLFVYWRRESGRSGREESVETQ